MSSPSRIAQILPPVDRERDNAIQLRQDELVRDAMDMRRRMKSALVSIENFIQKHGSAHGSARD